MPQADSLYLILEPHSREAPFLRQAQIVIGPVSSSAVDTPVPILFIAIPLAIEAVAVSATGLIP